MGCGCSALGVDSLERTENGTTKNENNNKNSNAPDGTGDESTSNAENAPVADIHNTGTNHGQTATNHNHRPPTSERFMAIGLPAVGTIAEKHPEILPHLDDIRLSGLVFPFKASPYIVDELIDWSVGSERIRDDPFYKLVFPTLDMLGGKHRAKLVNARAREDPRLLRRSSPRSEAISTPTRPIKRPSTHQR